MIRTKPYQYNIVKKLLLMKMQSLTSEVTRHVLYLIPLYWIGMSYRDGTPQLDVWIFGQWLEKAALILNWKKQMAERTPTLAPATQQ